MRGVPLAIAVSWCDVNIVLCMLKLPCCYLMRIGACFSEYCVSVRLTLYLVH